MYVCVRIYVWEEDNHEKREVRWERREDRTKTYSYRYTHRQTDRYKSFNDVGYHSEQYSKSDSIE